MISVNYLTVIQYNCRRNDPGFSIIDNGKRNLLVRLFDLDKMSESGIPHIKIMRANNFELFIQQVQIMIFVELKQGFFLQKKLIYRTCNGSH